MISDVERIFKCLLAICTSFFGEVSIQVLCPFFNWVVVVFGVEFCKYFIHFGFNPLSDVLANLFSYYVGCLFILLMISFTV